jgi:NADPH:quinone reductase-like Zn-dependent oxidoreductase
MKAVVIDEYGSNDVVRYTDIDTPEPKAGEVLIKVAAAGVNPIDWKIRSGAGQRMGMTLPIHLGGEISGMVAAVGQCVESLSPGDAIYGIIPSGAFAEYAVAKAADLTRKPANLDFIHAAAVPLGGLTAWQAMFDIAGLASGQRLLITNASGGVGSLAVQMAKAKGVHVTAIASKRNEEFVRNLGADDFIDYTTQPFEGAASDMDVVFDTVGGDTFERAFLTVSKGGFVVTSVAFPTDEAQRHGVGVARVQCKPDAEELALMRAMVEDGKLAAHIARVLPLTQIKEALALSELGHTRGKIVLQIAE